MVKFISRKEATEKLGIHFYTLYAMQKRGEIESIVIGKQRMYNVEKYLREKGVKESDKRRKICYCRVSSKKKKEDLKRQIEYMETKYPGYEIISDIGSGLNYERKGLKKILEYGISGEIEILVIAYRDRLTRFGYEMIEWIIKEYSKGELVVINKSEEKTPFEEISKDIIAIMNVYTAKINGLRKYKKTMVNELKNKKIENE